MLRSKWLRALTILLLAGLADSALMLFCCKRALVMSHREIFEVLCGLFCLTIHRSTLRKGLSVVIAAVLFSGILTYGFDRAIQTYFKKQVTNKQLD